ncbi:DNA-binding CsgD family transcriptional regulator [Catenulispora sp. MAP5-51]|uniref:helix-turn-helix transcriptional regulator n=1 Tax=Catenulispora sp. MAP5-51 TaxID=3156298 RepID=UPI003511B587
MLTTKADEYFGPLRGRARPRHTGAAHARTASPLEPDEALALFQNLLAAGTLAGPGQLAVVSGGIASGKTQLMHAFGQAAAGAGVLTLSATGAADEQHDFGVVEQLLAGSAQSAEAAHRIAPAPGHADVRLREDWQAGMRSWADDAAAVRGIRQILLDLATERPVVILVDDLNYADILSLQILLQLQRRIRSTRLLMVLSQPDRPTDHPLPHWVRTGLLPQHHIRLTPMTEHSIRNRVHAALGEAGEVVATDIAFPSDLLADPEETGTWFETDCVEEPKPDGQSACDLAALIHRLSGGNPLLVQALIDDCAEGGAERVPGAGYTHAVSTLLSRRDPLLSKAAGTLAVLDGDGAADTVAEIAELERPVAVTALSVLTAAGLLADGAFRHPAAAQAALACLTPAVLSDLHIRAAELKYRRAAPVGEIARHLVASADAPPGWAYPVLCAAADHAMLGDEPIFAQRCLELALDLASGPEQRRAVLGLLAGGMFRVNPLITQSYLAALRQEIREESAEHPATAAPSRGGTGSLSARQAESTVLARMALWNGDEAGFSQALDSLRSGPDPLDPQSEAVLMLAHQWCFGPPRSQLTEDAEPADVDPWIGTARSLASIWAHGGGTQASASAEQILWNCRLSDTTFEALLTAITALAYGGKTDLAEQWCAELSSKAAARGAVTWQAMIDGVWSGISLRRGDIPTAIALGESSLKMLSWGVPVGYPLTTLISAYTATRDFDRVEETLRHPVPDTVFNTVCGLRYLRARARYHLAADRPLAAITDIHECRRMMVRRDLDLPVLVPWRSDLAEAYLKMGNTTFALGLARQQLELSPESDCYSRGEALLVLAQATATENREERGRQAVASLEAAGDRLALARALKLLGLPGPQPTTIGTTTVNLEEARSRLRAPAPSVGIAGDVEREPTDSTALSEAELRVARLAVMGRTNRQIGNALFITVSTVEQHLTRIYKKLGIRGRSDLPATLSSI